MNGYLLLIGSVIAICILLNRFAEKLPVPSLLIFIALGMCFGVNGILGIPFDDYSVSESICTVSLIFVMFYGGFGTNFATARPAAGRAVLLSTIGVAATAGLVGLFARFALGLSWLESFLIGAVISSTDAASVFNILRSQKLGLKDNTASLLELESGSNDPCSYMLTILVVSMMTGESISVPVLLAKQVIIGGGFGLLLGKGSVLLLNKITCSIEQGKTILVFAIALLGYAIPASLGGNGYLSVYLCGIYMGNCFLPDKKELVHFFDALTGIAQMMIFFLLGLLVTPAELPAVFFPALLIMGFLTFAARPLAVFFLLKPAGASLPQIGLVSWAGLRGVASIVFSIYAVLNGTPMRYNLFNLVFCIVILSLAFQGSLLAKVSRFLGMIDETADVRKTFNDYQEESDVSFVKIHIGEGHPMSGLHLKDASLPPNFLVALILRGENTIVPNGETEIQKGDLLILAAETFEDRENLMLSEISVDKGHKWRGRALKDIKLGKGILIVMIQRGKNTIIPGGDDVIEEGDILAVARF